MTAQVIISMIASVSQQLQSQIDQITTHGSY